MLLSIFQADPGLSADAASSVTCLLQLHRGMGKKLEVKSSGCASRVITILLLGSFFVPTMAPHIHTETKQQIVQKMNSWTKYFDNFGIFEHFDNFGDLVILVIMMVFGLIYKMTSGSTL